MIQAFTYDGTTCPICFNPYGGGVGLGTCPHMYHLQCITPFMVQHRHCVLCRTLFHSPLYAMFNLKHCMSPHWEYNAQNAHSYEKKWGTDLLCKWWHGLHALDFAMNFVSFEKYITMVTIACHALYPNQIE
jgi:hypothetical protein